ncbi:uncharacterized protein LOC126972565 [Leptidea sinapis]|uniref:MAD2L1-binding protein n=1 Tax=Leptidea sinapis TaxID=189913 RepID=A0A5E4QUD4_9NEOP|nr:uncharacterized protein LOC126972565 [Leptidea sinapis]VVD01585.1 unnamed protein product [Leptidea sinapis]
MLQTEKINIDSDIGDQLTSISLGHIVAELIKFIAYQRLQIPYTYQWLKQLVTKKKEAKVVKDSYQSERYFHVASSALDNLDYVIKSIIKEVGGVSLPDEICIAFGATPISCKEIYRILLPSVCHKPQCHSNNIATDQKIQKNVFRNLVTSEQLSKIFYEPLPPTKMYIFLKILSQKQQDVICHDSFVIVNGYKIPKSCKVVIINFRTSNTNMTCCNEFEVFSDQISNSLSQVSIEGEDSDALDEIETTENVKWFQSMYVMKGFKDCIVNGSSITNSWFQSS